MELTIYSTKVSSKKLGSDILYILYKNLITMSRKKPQNMEEHLSRRENGGVTVACMEHDLSQVS